MKTGSEAWVGHHTVTLEHFLSAQFSAAKPLGRSSRRLWEGVLQSPGISRASAVGSCNQTALWMSTEPLNSCSTSTRNKATQQLTLTAHSLAAASFECGCQATLGRGGGNGTGALRGGKMCPLPVWKQTVFSSHRACWHLYPSILSLKQSAQQSPVVYKILPRLRVGLHLSD